MQFPKMILKFKYSYCSQQCCNCSSNCSAWFPKFSILVPKNECKCPEKLLSRFQQRKLQLRKKPSIIWSKQMFFDFLLELSFPGISLQSVEVILPALQDFHFEKYQKEGKILDYMNEINLNYLLFFLHSFLPKKIIKFFFHKSFRAVQPLLGN